MPRILLKSLNLWLSCLSFYKIGVPNADLNKALDPSIWPLRVRVREFIHYSNKPNQASSDPNRVNHQQVNSNVNVETLCAAQNQVNGRAHSVPTVLLSPVGSGADAPVNLATL